MHHTQVSNTTPITAQDVICALRPAFSMAEVETSTPDLGLEMALANLDAMGGQLEYEKVVLMLASQGLVARAIKLFEQFGATHALLSLTSATGRTSIDTLVWPGSIKLDGAFTIGHLVCGQDLVHSADCVILDQSVGGEVVGIADSARDAAPRPVLEVGTPIIIDPSLLPECARA